MKPPMPYAGGKQALAGRIVDLLPAHHHYVEPFAGALSVLLAKSPSTLETVNDLDGEIVAFWRVLRDQPQALARRCALTPHSRRVYMDARLDFTPTDDLTKAWRTWVRLSQGRGSRTNGNSGWRFVQGGTTRHALARYLGAYVERMAPAAERLMQVSIENRPALDVIESYDRPATVFYVDPPYVASTRYGSMYRHELGTEAEHNELLDALEAVKGKVVLSGYRTDLYDRRLTGWRRLDLPTTCMTGVERIESLWLNYDPPQTATLFAHSELKAVPA